MDHAPDPNALEALHGVPVLYEDNHLLALDKPAGLLTQGAEAGDDNLLERGREYLRRAGGKPGKAYVGLVHRLDRNVSGVLLLARTSKAASRLSQAFAGRDVDKRYVAVVEGLTPEHGELRDRLEVDDASRRTVRGPGGKEASLAFERVGEAAGRSVLLVRLHTGRRHQIRAQLALAGHPIVGDPLYGARARAIERPALHAWRLTLSHPVRREPLRIVAPVPDDLRRLMDGVDLDALLPGI
ncbi:MAG: RNA pseudouridine synthase [Deltaproteobacteria bacterium]|nr:RNA pseudouridine synthase [Deltaproteobacteria bacterium]MCB9786363.1 RNA pseudouridine synthase [Deltaproteobacteria bacterium]